MDKKTREACSRLPEDIRAQAMELSKIEQAMRKKINETLDIFKDMPLSQTVYSTQGDLVKKSNPEIQQAQALFRDYSAIVKAQHDLLGTKPTEEEVSDLDSLRRRFRIAK